MNKKYIKYLDAAIIALIPEIGHILIGVIDKQLIIKIFEIPHYYYVFTAIILLIYLIFYLIDKYIERKMYDGMIYGIEFNKSLYGYNKIFEIEENGLLWVIREPITIDNLYKNKIEVDPEPRCPNCNPMKLEYAKHKLWHQWTCINCNYKVRTWNHEDKIEDRVLKRAEYEMKKYLS